RNIGWTTTHAFMPFFSDLAVKSSQIELREAFVQYSKYVVALMLPLCAGAVLLGPVFIGLWIGQEYVEKAPLIVAILVVYIALPFLNPFSTRYLTAVNKHGYSAKVYTVAAISNLILSLILVQIWGIEGVALGSLIPMLVLVPVLMKYGFSSLELKFTHYFSRVILPVLPALMAMILGVSIYQMNVSISSYLELVGAVSVGGLVYAVAFLFSGLSEQERSFLKNRFFAK
ncbi:lipopolysaccharide biosynthesis protein, partial [Oleiphilus sp. HI0067]